MTLRPCLAASGFLFRCMYQYALTINGLLRHGWQQYICGDGLLHKNKMCVMDEKGCETMIISNSAVTMNSNRAYSTFLYSEKESAVMKKDDAVAMQLSDDGISMLEKMRELKHSSGGGNGESASAFAIHASASRHAAASWEDKRSDSYEMKLKLIERMLEALRNGKHGRFERLSKELKSYDSQRRQSVGMSQGYSFSLAGASSSTASGGAVLASGNGAAAGTRGSGTLVKVTAEKGMFSEMEAVTFAGTGVAVTQDGRQIGFNVELGLSRAFCAEYENVAMQDYICVDPLVINIGADSAQISDQKILFDIDSDGKEEQLSMLGEGSGFLALDKNGDGKINDGSELFGTKSGDGFKDLAQYDKDGNGWIDEADEIFSKLKVWTFDEDGNSQLIDLKEAGVGAIYLGSSATQYHLNDEKNATQAIIRKTGVFLKENGEAGTVQHVDFAI